jgi:hypothetical protein
VEAAPPFVVSAPPECAFYRSIADVSAAAALRECDVFDSHGMRLSMTSGGLTVSSVDPDVLAHVLRRWLAGGDVPVESTASWPLWLLIHVSIERGGYS